MLRQPHALILVCVVILVMAAAPVLPAASQTTYIPWGTFTTDDGLATNEDYALYQDKTGDMWLATAAGVNRFNGRWRTYTIANGLISNRVRAITQSRDMRSIWIATLDGVSRLTTASDGTESWQSFDAASGLLNNSVRAVMEAQDGSLWFGTADGISVLTIQADNSISWTQVTADDGLAPGQVTALLQDTNGAIWAGTTAGVARFDGQRWSDVIPSEGLALARINAILQDRAGDIWFATEGSGVVQFSQAEGSWRHYTAADGLPDNNVWSIWQDVQGNYWFGANFGGVAHFVPTNPEDEQWSLFTVSNSGLIANSVRAIWEDPTSGSLWFATTAGLNRYDWRQWHSSLPGDNGAPTRVFALTEDDEGRLWAGTDSSGLFVRDDERWLSVGLSDDPAQPADFVSSLRFDHEGRMWVGTNGNGLFVREEDQWRPITETAIFTGATVIAITEQKDGTLWFGTFDGLVQRPAGAGSGADFWRMFGATDGLPGQRIQALLVDSHDRLWVGTDSGLGVFNGSGWRTYSKENSALPANDIRSLVETSDGSIWVGTWASGIGRLNPETEQWQVLTVADGLVSNGVVALLRDQNDAILIGTEGGISRFDGSTWQSYQETDGLAGGIVTTMFQDSQGIYWLATAGGMRRYQPEARQPWVRVTSINSRILNGSPLQLTSADQVTIDFSGGDQETVQTALLYQYRLLPVAEAWQTTRNPRVRFGALTPGAYTFEIRVRDEAMNYSPVTQAALTVTRPPAVVVLPIVGSVSLSSLVFGVLMIAIAVGTGSLGLTAWLRGRRRPRQALQRKFNPYVSGEPVRRDDLFFGRHEQLKRILTVLHRNSVMIHGERRIGKTSLLFQLADRLREASDPDCVFVPVLVDLEGTPETEFFHRLMEAIVEVLPADERAKLELAYRPSATEYTARDMRRDLRLIIAHLQEQATKTVRLILLLDEVDVMNDYDQLTQQQLRRIFMEQFAQNLGAVVAGVRISKAWDRLESPWYNLFNEIELMPFGREDALALLQEPVKGVYRWDQDALEFIVAHANGRPYRIQQYGMESVNRMFEGNRTTIQLADVEGAHEAIQRMAET